MAQPQKRTPLVYRITGNELSFKGTGQGWSAPLPGTFSIGTQNDLIFTGTRALPDGTQNARFSGTWALTRRHELTLQVTKSSLALSTGLIRFGGTIGRPGPRSFSFALTERPGQKLSVLDLKGSWGNDTAERLSFEARKNYGTDRLTLRNRWHLSPQNQIAYTYAAIGRKKSTTVTFDGYWDITRRDRLCYVFERTSAPSFSFRAQLQTRTIYAKTGQIRYRLGAGARHRRSGTTITLFGTWKYSRRLDLSFETTYGRTVHRNRLIMRITSVRGNRLSATLYNNRRQAFGAEIVFTPAHMPRSDREYFLSFTRGSGETRVLTGVRSRF